MSERKNTVSEISNSLDGFNRKASGNVSIAKWQVSKLKIEERMGENYLRSVG